MDGAGLLNTEQAARLLSIASYSTRVSTHEWDACKLPMSDS